MVPSTDNVLVLFPGALGDFLCALPALWALRAAHAGPMRIIARPGLLELIDWPRTSKASIDCREISNLFATGQPIANEPAQFLGAHTVAHSWTGFGVPEFAERLQAAMGGQVHVHPFRGMQPGEHAADYYARCVGRPPACPPFPVVEEAGWVLDLQGQMQPPRRRLVVVHPGSGSAAKNWEGYAAAIELWRQRHEDELVVTLGPAEDATFVRALAAATIVRGRSLPALAGLLRRCDLYLGNDSGVSHLAACVGTYGVVLFGPSDPATWAPRSERLRVLHAPRPCTACGPERFCEHRLPVGTVVESLESQGCRRR